MEPSTNAEWSHKITSNTLSSLIIKETFVKNVYFNIKRGPYRKWNTAKLVKLDKLAFEEVKMLGDDTNSPENPSLVYQRPDPETDTKPVVYYFNGDFEKTIASNFDNDNIEGRDKFKEIFRKYSKVVKLKTERDLELIIESHSNGFLRVEIRLLENEEIVK
jgi:hypothetical protein